MGNTPRHCLQETLVLLEGYTREQFTTLLTNWYRANKGKYKVCRRLWGRHGVHMMLLRHPHPRRGTSASRGAPQEPEGCPDRKLPGPVQLAARSPLLLCRLPAHNGQGPVPVPCAGAHLCAPGAGPAPRVLGCAAQGRLPAGD